MAGKFVNINELHIDLIDQVNPFQKAFEILSKSVTKQVLKVIQLVQRERAQQEVDGPLRAAPLCGIAALCLRQLRQLANDIGPHVHVPANQKKCRAHVVF